MIMWPDILCVYRSYKRSLYVYVVNVLCITVINSIICSYSNELYTPLFSFSWVIERLKQVYYIYQYRHCALNLNSERREDPEQLRIFYRRVQHQDCNSFSRTHDFPQLLYVICFRAHSICSLLSLRTHSCL